PHEEQLRRHLPQGHSGSCGAGRSTIGIEADGTIKGCPSLHTGAWGGGSVTGSSIRDIWERATPLRYTRDRTVDDLWGYCRTCYYAAECKAGCTWTAHSLFGKPGNNPYCHHRALELARAGQRERIERVQRAPGEPFDHALFEIITEPLPRVPAAVPVTPCTEEN
ncbi:MAG TPA: SPASM domain-containing protein, partial [Polyangiaceae bacterium]|nr:SPASM domain-containing protein [Polyangiaceae bacterium]